MSKNIVMFPSKVAYQSGRVQLNNPFGLDTNCKKYEVPPELMQRVREFDFRNALDNFPEIGEGRRRDKFFVLTQAIPLTDFISAAYLALDVKGDTQAYQTLLDMHHFLRQEGFKKFPCHSVNPKLVGYLVNLIEDRGVVDNEVPEIYCLADSYFGRFQLSGWSSLADYERTLRRDNGLV